MLSTIFSRLLTVFLTTSVFANVLANRVDEERVALTPNSLLTELLTSTVPTKTSFPVGVAWDCISFPLSVQNRFLISNRFLNNEPPLFQQKSFLYT